MEWLKDNRTNVAALFLSKNIEVLGHRTGDGHLLIRLKDLDIVCCYVSPNIGMQDYRLEVDNIMNVVNNTKTIILGDINAKSPQWGGHKTDKKGEYWLEWINALDMIVLNTGQKPTFVRGNTESFIDVTIATKVISKRIINWEVLDMETLTEHKYIGFEIQGIKSRKEVRRSRTMVDWDIFRSKIMALSEAEQETEPVACTNF
ncbi:Endonuclease-reverse transcriptase [Popillia japonica]|uniref:Endonuclease-reverse transcriptase n=1 Tax=Popillia japonica TaxID=7064 RepID=A0AAW1KM52_POPJA